MKIKINQCVSILNAFSDVEALDVEQNEGKVNPRLFYALKINRDRITKKISRIIGLFESLQKYDELQRKKQQVRDNNLIIEKDKKGKELSRKYDEEKMKEEITALDKENETIIKNYRESMDQEIEIEDFFQIKTEYLPKMIPGLMDYLMSQNLIME
jgi:hypothetical protein